MSPFPTGKFIVLTRSQGVGLPGQILSLHRPSSTWLQGSQIYCSARTPSPSYSKKYNDQSVVAHGVRFIWWFEIPLMRIEGMDIALESFSRSRHLQSLSCFSHYGLKRSTFHFPSCCSSPPFSPPSTSRYLNRSCNRLSLPCQNSTILGFTLNPPQNSGT